MVGVVRLLRRSMSCLLVKLLQSEELSDVEVGIRDDCGGDGGYSISNDGCSDGRDGVVGQGRGRAKV